MPDREERLAVDSPIDVGHFPERESHANAFEKKGPRILKPVPESERKETAGSQGPRGDSGPDRIDPSSTKFEDISGHPTMSTTRDPQDQPQVRKENPEFREGHRAEPFDEIAAQYEFVTEGEKAILRPMASTGNAQDNRISGGRN